MVSAITGTSVRHGRNAQELYKQSLNDKKRPNPEVQNSGLEGRKVLVLPVANSNQGGRW
jgi:hypothetical protein